MLLVSAGAAGKLCHAVLAAAVGRMLQRAARANAHSRGDGGVRRVTRLLCSVCGSQVAPSNPVKDSAGNEGSDGEDDDTDAARHSCACGCPASVRLSWSGRLWSTLQVATLLPLRAGWTALLFCELMWVWYFGAHLTTAQCTSCSARCCIDCAQVEYQNVQCDRDEDGGSMGDGMPPVRTGLGEALLLLYGKLQLHPRGSHAPSADTRWCCRQAAAARATAL